MDSSDLQAEINELKATITGDAAAAEILFIGLTERIVEKKDLEAAISCAKIYIENSGKMPSISKTQVREVIRRSAGSPLQKLILDNVGLTDATLPNLVKRIETLLSLHPGVYVSSQSWGFGIITKLDEFYGKVLIDFMNKSNHSMSFAVAGQNLSVADENHIMTRLLKNREEICKLAVDKPVEILRMTIESFGPMPVQRVEEILINAGIIKPVAGKPGEEGKTIQDVWKSFWTNARYAAKSNKDRPIQIPAKRSDNIVLLDSAETYGDTWLQKFKNCRSPKGIYDMALSYGTSVKWELNAAYREAFSERLKFAMLGAYKTDPARYSQIVVLLDRDELKLSSPEEIEAECNYLADLDEKIYLIAAKNLAARDVIALYKFLLKYKSDCKASILDSIPEMDSVGLGALLEVLKDDDDAGVVVRHMLHSKSPVPTLLVWALRNREQAEKWQLPSLFELLMQSVHVIEQRLTGENLRMRNTLQRFFDTDRWLKDACQKLSDFHRKVLFERVQAASAWESSSKRDVVNRMCNWDNKLAKSTRSSTVVVRDEPYTSWRSLAELQKAYDYLIRVEIPKNTKDIEVTRGYGDLRENFEYHAAKDLQRVLLTRQEQMATTLKTVKGSNFANVKTSSVVRGTSVTLDVNGKTLKYTILGDLDRDEKLNIISCKSALGKALLRKKAGDEVMIPSAEGEVKAKITEISLPDDAVKAWLAVRPEE